MLFGEGGFITKTFAYLQHVLTSAFDLIKPCCFENLNERERKGERAAAAWRTRGGGKANARRRRGGQREDGAIAVYLSARSSTSKRSSAANNA
jgi:hypothetical protein